MVAYKGKRHCSIKKQLNQNNSASTCLSAFKWDERPRNPQNVAICARIACNLVEKLSEKKCGGAERGYNRRIDL